ncbi:M48 family metallopeptidase [Amycolatopsis sp. NPDC059657]|uniref:M48 family metallopeptidase n=1 Tax=Amycolatopsis sp. NPDC059657 TaxID=3346899 RepID=UPI00366D7350
MLLLVAFPFVVIAVGAGGVYAGVQVGHRAGGYIMLAGIGVMLALGFGLVSALRAKFPTAEGPRLTREEQPGLWRVVDDLAAQVSTRPPDEIVLVGEINAAVYEESRLLGLRAGRRTLLIGLPLLAAMNVTELRAILAHELGHYSGGHTRMLAVTYRGTRTLEHTVGRLDSGLAKTLLDGYSRLYLLVAQSANRRQELQADEYMVTAAGKRVAANALRKVATLSPLWNAYLDRYVSLGAVTKRTPDVLLGFRAFLKDPAQREWVAKSADAILATEPSSRFNSHPSTRHRIAAIAGLPDVRPELDGRPAWTLLDSPREDIPHAELDVLIRDLGPRASWDEIVRLAGLRSVHKGAAMLAEAGKESGLAPGGTIGEVIQVLRHGDIERLAEPMRNESLAPDVIAEASEQIVTELLGDAIVAALADAGHARHELNWGGGWDLKVYGQPFDIEALVKPAVEDPRAVGELVHHLQRLRVPAAFVRPPSAEPEEEPEPVETRLLAIMSALQDGRKLVDLLVCTTELVLVRMSRWVLVRRGFAGLIGAAGMVDRKRLKKLDPKTVDAYRRIPLSTVSGGGFTQRRLTEYLVLSLPDGELRLALSNHVSDFGDARERLEDFLARRSGD